MLVHVYDGRVYRHSIEANSIEEAVDQEVAYCNRGRRKDLLWTRESMIDRGGFEYDLTARFGHPIWVIDAPPRQPTYIDPQDLNS